MFNRKQRDRETRPDSIENIDRAAFPVIPFSFNGSTIACKVRCLNGVQLRAIGEFSLIDISKISEKEAPSLQDIINTRNWQEAVIKETLISPTFNEILDKIYSKDNRINELKARAKKIRHLIDKVEDNKDKKDLQKEIDSIELYIGTLLPDDFMNDVTAWATGSNRTDIKKLTRETLLEAAILANNGKDNPADHLSGNFLDWHKDEINKAAWQVFNDYQREKQIEDDHKGIFGKNARVFRGGPVRIK
jgi:hypothetical protein